MVLKYIYHTEEFLISADWDNSDGRSVIHTKIVEQLAARHGEAFLGYWVMARELDEKTDKLCHCAYIFSDEYQAAPYNPGIRRQFLSAFSELCLCLEINMEGDDLEPSQVILSLFQMIQGHLQELVGIYLTDHAYQNKYRKRMKTLKAWEEISDGEEISVEFEETFTQMLDISRMLGHLTEIQRRRLVQHLFLGRTLQEIARQEKVSKQSVEESIAAAIKKLRSL